MCLLESSKHFLLPGWLLKKIKAKKLKAIKVSSLYKIFFFEVITHKIRIPKMYGLILSLLIIIIVFLFFLGSAGVPFRVFSTSPALGLGSEDSAGVTS